MYLLRTETKVCAYVRKIGTDFHCHGKLHKNYSYSMKRNRTCQSCDLATLTISLENTFVDKRVIELFEMEQKS